MDFMSSIKQAYQDDRVQSALKKWNTWKDTKSNLFSEATADFVKESNVIPDAVKQGYLNSRGHVMEATMGLAGSNVLTKALRYQKPLNKVIDKTVQAVDIVADKTNKRIDDFVASHSERGNEIDIDYSVGQPAGLSL